MTERFRSRLLILAGCLALATTPVAAEVTREDILAWLAAENFADPPAAGSVIGIDAIGTLDPWLPPGYRDEFRFPEVRVEIQATTSYPGHHTYQDASARFAGQATLGADGRLENYTAGQPFSGEQIRDAEPDAAGYMVAWNNIHRWQNYGYQVDELTMSYVAPGNAPAPLDADGGLLGGGSLDRVLTQSYHRVYLSKLAMLPEQDYRIDVRDSNTHFFKDYIEFLDPFNVKGTKFVVERLLDPRADDQVNTYLPTERRVRRFSAKERADSFMGSNGTLDDFEGFSGRVLDYTWHYIGRKALLYVADTKHEVQRTYGPTSRFPDDRWQVRDCHVVEVKSVWDGHPYGSRILFLDAETFNVPLSLVTDHDGRLWKTLQTILRGPRSTEGAEDTLEASVQSWRGQVNIDRNLNTATVVRALTETRHPTMNPAQIKRIFSVSSLTSGQ